MSKDHYEENDERMNIIGQNGNDGLHYGESIITDVYNGKFVLIQLVDTTVELTLTLSSPASLVADDFFNRTVRQIVVGTGPQGDGLGCALMLPAAMLTVDPSAYDVSGNDIVRQQLTYSQSRFGGDVVESNAANSPFRLGLGI